MLPVEAGAPASATHVPSAATRRAPACTPSGGVGRAVASAARVQAATAARSGRRLGKRIERRSDIEAVLVP
jgi:hypothetical protein